MSGIYFHIPFCKQACHYCNFHFSTSLRYKAPLVDALLHEIQLTPQFNAIAEDSGSIETIYFGGGTPSLLNKEELSRLLNSIYKAFPVSDTVEITLEANPDDINQSSLQQWKQLGINRLSVGIQSFQEEELRWMNRAHTAAESLHCIDLIGESGFDNYSIDLIYGSPLLSNENWRKNVFTVIDKKIPHLSCYALTVEPQTPLAKKIRNQTSPDVNTDKQAEQFLLLMQWLREAGYEHYEISNYALPGFRSKHNSSYWQGKMYYGFGPSAHSYDGTHRRWNIANNNLYIQSLNENKLPFEEELLSPDQQLHEYIMTALRTIEGMNLNWIQVKYGEEKATLIEKTIRRYVQAGQVKNTNTVYTLTDEGKLFADGIAADLFI